MVRVIGKEGVGSSGMNGSRKDNKVYVVEYIW